MAAVRVLWQKRRHPPLQTFPSGLLLRKHNAPYTQNSCPETLTEQIRALTQTQRLVLIPGVISARQFPACARTLQTPFLGPFPLRSDTPEESRPRNTLMQGQVNGMQ